VEIHIPGLQKNLYQEYLKISLVQRIRDEIKFASPEALRAQIARDIKRADRILQESPLQDDRQ
jgi:riboflavin kinase/FMN adenylyltransferase